MPDQDTPRVSFIYTADFGEEVRTIWSLYGHRTE